MLRDYQQKDLDRIINTFVKTDSILFEACVSYGKTYLACAFIEKCIGWGKNVIFCVNRESLVMQALNDFSSIKEHVSVLKSGYEHLFDNTKQVQLVMLHSFNARKDLLQDFDAHVIITDECHLYHGGAMMEGLIKQFPDAKRLGITGTPITELGYLLEGYQEYMQTISMKELIADNTLATPIYYESVNNCNFDDIKLKGNDFDSLEVDKIVLDVNQVNKIVDTWRQHALNKKTIIFANSIKHANKIQKAFADAGFNAYLLHSNISTKDREALLKDFREGKRTIIINVAMLVEGFSDTEVECILFACPTKILRKFIQSSGRGFRRSKTKTECIFLDCCGVFAIHGKPDDYRFYTVKKPKNDEPLFQQCPECGNIEPIHVKQCSICGYDLTIAIEQGKGTSKATKKQLEQLIRTYSLQDEVYNKIRELVKERGHKAGYAWFLFKSMLEKKATGSMLQFYKTRLTKIERIRKNGWKLGSLVYR